MTDPSDSVLLGGVSTSRKELTNFAMAAVLLPLQRLGTIVPSVLLEFHPEAEAETIDWFLGKILEPESLGGADLLGRVVSRTSAGGAVVVVGATPERLLLEADESLLFRHRPRRSGSAERPRRSSDVGDQGGRSSSTPHAGGVEGLGGMLSSAEAATLLLRILERLRVSEWEELRANMPLLPGEAAMAGLRRRGVVTGSYLLHDALLLEGLKQGWRASWCGLRPFSGRQQRQLLEEIRSYFGEEVANYFGFLESLINALLLRSALGVFLYFFPISQGCGHAFSSLSAVVWSGLFLEGWKQKSKALEEDWGTTAMQQPVSAGRAPPQPRDEPSADEGWGRCRRSATFLVCTLLPSTVLLLAYLHLDAMLWTYLHLDASNFCCLLMYLPDVSLTIAMAAVDHLALALCRRLGPDPPYPGTTSSSRQPLLPELVLSCLFNHFAVHLYRALALRDLITLRHHLLAQLATRGMLRLLTGAVLPLVWMRRRTEAPPGRGQSESQPTVLRQIQEQGERPPGNGEETRAYLEILTAYGHVMLFSGVCPQCAPWCLLAAVAQCQLDGWRLCSAVRRPFPQATPPGGIGAWQRVFEAVEALAIAANAALLWSSPEFRLLLLGFTQWEVLEVLLGLQVFLVGLRSAMVSLTRRISGDADQQAERPGHRHLRQHRIQRWQTP